MTRIVEAGRGGLWLPAALALALWLWVSLPVALGHRTFFFRDVLGNHLALKAFGAEALARGEIPAFNPRLGLGQPFRGNPSALPFYPDNLLYLVLPFWSAFNLHYALHWLLAALAMYVLARELGQTRAAALLAGVTYAGSGYLLSCLTFYNLITVVAWWPLAIAGAVRGGRRGIALGGLACGLALLGGEPLTAALGLLPMLLAAVQRHGSLRGLTTCVAVGGLGLLVAAPQVVATARILGFTFRAAHGTLLVQATYFTLPPQRFLELLLPLPFGWPVDLGPAGWWAWKLGPEIGYFLSLYPGIIGLWLAAAAVRRRLSWALLSLAGLAFAWLWGAAGQALVTLSLGVFRYPERFLFWYALALALLAGWGLEAALADERGPRRTARWAGGVLLVSGLAAAAWRPVLLSAAAAQSVRGPIRVGELLRTQSIHWIVYLLIAGSLLVVAGWMTSRRRAPVLVGLQIVALAQLFPLVRTTATAPFRHAVPWMRLLPPSAAVFHSLKPRPMWEPPPSFEFPAGSRDVVAWQNALDLEAAPGFLHGLSYPLWPNMEGLSSPFHSLLTIQLAQATWTQRVAWLRVMGVDAAVFHQPVRVPGLDLRDRARRFGRESFLYRVEHPAPFAWWPASVESTSGPLDALERVSALADPRDRALVAYPLQHHPGAEVAVVRSDADRVEVEVAGRGGLLVVRRSYHPMLRARSGGRALPTQPVDLILTGIEVPAGHHRVTLQAEAGPEKLAAMVALLAALAAALLGLLPVRGTDAEPAPASALPEVLPATIDCERRNDR